MMIPDYYSFEMDRKYWIALANTFSAIIAILTLHDLTKDRKKKSLSLVKVFEFDSYFR